MFKRYYVPLTVVALLTPLSALGQYEPDPGEIGVYSGGTFSGGAHPFVGGSAGLAYSKYAVGLIDFSYTHLDTDTLRHVAAHDVKGSNLYDCNFSVHIRYPVNEKWAPYGIAGPSVVWNGYSYGTLGANGAHIYTSKQDVNFGFHTGAGVRYYINENWGIRPEVKVILTGRTYVVFSLGFFFNTPGGI
jgi:opacity protein-like surface antigen